MEDPIETALKSLQPVKKKTHTVFAKAQDNQGQFVYLMADTEAEIEHFCENGVLGDELAIEAWCYNVTPIMACFHYKWVGSRRNPFVIAKPIYKYDDNGKFIGYTEFKEKF